MDASEKYKQLMGHYSSYIQYCAPLKQKQEYEKWLTFLQTIPDSSDVYDLFLQVHSQCLLNNHTWVNNIHLLQLKISLLIQLCLKYIPSHLPLKHIIHQIHKFANTQCIIEVLHYPKISLLTSRKVSVQQILNKLIDMGHLRYPHLYALYCNQKYIHPNSSIGDYIPKGMLRDQTFLLFQFVSLENNGKTVEEIS